MFFPGNTKNRKDAHHTQYTTYSGIWIRLTMLIYVEPSQALSLHNSVLSLQCCQVGGMRIIGFILYMGIWRLARRASMLTSWRSQGLVSSHSSHDALPHTLPSVDTFWQVTSFRIMHLERSSRAGVLLEAFCSLISSRPEDSVSVITLLLCQPKGPGKCNRKWACSGDPSCSVLEPHLLCSPTKSSFNDICC